MTVGHDENILFLNFAKEYVEMILSASSSVSSLDTNVPLSETSPLVVRGYLLDEDSQYYYLGDESTNIMAAVRKNNVITITIGKEKSVYDELLSSLDVPNKGEGN